MQEKVDNWNSLPVARFALVPDAQDAHDIAGRVVDIQTHIAGVSARNDQFAQFSLHSPPDKRVAGEDPSGIECVGKGVSGSFGRLFDKKLGKTLEVLERLSRENYLRHFTGAGRFAFSPRALARMYSRTSSAA